MSKGRQQAGDIVFLHRPNKEVSAYVILGMSLQFLNVFVVLVNNSSAIEISIASMNDIANERGVIQ